MHNDLPINLIPSRRWIFTVMILSFGQIGLGKQCRPRSDLLLEEQSVLGLHYLLFPLHHFDKITKGLASLNWAASWENRIFAYAKTKTQISFAVTAKLISAFVFATWIVQSLYFLNPKFQVSSHLLWLYSPVCVRTWAETPKTGFLTSRLNFTKFWCLKI